MNKLQRKLRDLYLEYLNDFITIQFMAEEKQIPEKLMRDIVAEGRRLHNEEVEMIQAMERSKSDKNKFINTK